jgi:predicted GNAT family acetyltransferase
MGLQVEKIDHDDVSVRKRLFDFLAPHEAYCLFITGNLKRSFPDSHIYIAKQGEDWVGVAGYYGIFCSVVPFAFEPETARALAKHIAEHHPAIKYLNGVSTVAAPACEELHRMGYKLAGDPRCIFMQMYERPPRQPFEELARPMATADHKDVVRLHRYLRGKPQDSPITAEELRIAAINPSCYVLSIDGEIVSTASTNGMGISAFQIIGVATHTEHRNKGYARTVCASLIRAMWAAGARQCVLFTEIENVAAQACYRKLGFQPNGEYWVARLTRDSTDFAN